MSARRLVTTTVLMALVAVLLAALTPPIPVMVEALGSAQRTADTAGPDTLVICGAGLLAWAAWGWGALGLALTAATAVPGVLGATADLLLHVVLPAGARRSAALAVGLSLAVATPLLGTAVAPASAATSSPAAVPDWPAPAVPVLPDWPAPAGAVDSDPVPDWPAGSHVVLRGECLWQIAGDRLLQNLGRAPTHAETASEVRAWWTANADVIGPDPDLLLPGQVLRPPDRP